MKNQQIVWCVVFSVILLLTQLTSFYDFGTQSFFLGIPNWVLYFAIVQLLFIACLYIFSQQVFKKEE